MQDVLTVDRNDGIAILTLSEAARRNPIGTALLAQLDRAIESMRTDDNVRALVLCGEGAAFSAGADLTEIAAFGTAIEFHSFIGRISSTLDRLQELSKPSVAALHGFALGGGFELALACDLRVAERGTQLGLPEVKLGLLPGASGTQRLTRLVAPTVARQIILTGEPLTAERAYELGLIVDLVDAGESRPAAIRLAQSLAATAPLALAAGKRLIDGGAAMSLASAVAYEREAVSMLFTSSDRDEGLRAFRERRKPVFRGC
ncbi:enoyl-CoA hydratase/isomerase family protein [Mycobacterium sp. CVI_P3]|uniref:Enoyl-CoA hydratase/isomerase family protein n=1 Tax=Mycobacterium pinniadriaticum TaxID=2994102 RepID=A0ABT3SQR1_9MYCO|nr:enoyl-CoA hydratase/isomerase family protein [Mycobacterium pinniadriaticum]MCX2934745.1 enoyl-CoA hydratase/isomerase family protein [Mycobacterium pinniadriaticum]MCX2941167.1 enoyl-CoA hydratase/isomerase family protein [Mycobacterium pinniadriaticum]